MNPTKFNGNRWSERKREPPTPPNTMSIEIPNVVLTLHFPGKTKEKLRTLDSVFSAAA
ncbi:hypothetical protein Ancab_013759, partial [Ancistrocladus abbreviatus]